jgi:hypothetical protein
MFIAGILLLLRMIAFRTVDVAENVEKYVPTMGFPHAGQ